MAQTPDVYHGFGSWIEYSRSSVMRRVWTLSTYEAGILTNFVAVVLTLATALLFILCRHVIHLCWSKSPDSTHENAGPTPNDTAEATQSDVHLNNEAPTRPQNSASRDGGDIVNGTANNPEGMQLSTSGNRENTPVGSDQTRATTEPNGSSVQRNDLEGEATEHDSLLASPNGKSGRPKSKLEILMSRETLQGVSLQYLISAWNVLKPGPKTSVSEHLMLGLTWKRFFLHLGLSILCIAVFVGFTIATIYVAQLASDGICLSASPLCGKWELDLSIDILSPFSYMQEMESGDYARRCYNVSSGADGCNFFFTQNIGYQGKNDTCPFADGFCLGDDSPAYTLSTGLVKSQDLGINVPIGYTFNRTSTCAPIRRDGYYSVTDDDLIDYNYGPLFPWEEQENITWTANPDYSIWTGPGYDVSTFCRVAANGLLGWQPIPEFLPQINTHITLMLVFSQENFHQEYRSDPIFPAETLYLVGSEFLWMNNDLVATVLACTDQTSICTAIGDVCWDASDYPAEEPQDQIEKDGLYMLQIALQKSSICHSILLRGGAALDASTKLFVANSLPLAAEQWKVEAQNLFATSLVRTQIALRDYVRGSAAKEPGYVNLLKPEHAGMCNRYKFKGVGWTNVSVWGFWFAMIGSLMVFILAFTFKVSVSVPGNVANGEAQKIVKVDRLVIEILGTWIWKAWKWIGRRVGWIWNKSVALMGMYRR